MTMLSTPWSDVISKLTNLNHPYALATVISSSGSSPRGSGSKMVITSENTYDSIGGGKLEFQIINRARELLNKNFASQEIKEFYLSSTCKQCCGGTMTVLIETFIFKKIPLAIFGGGHIANELVQIIGDLDFDISWLDSRESFSSPGNGRKVPDYIEKPDKEISNLDEGSYVLILTHDHELDYLLMKELLEDWRWSYVGLIGSKNKSRKFRARLKNDGLHPDDVNRFQCPIGIEGIKSKKPKEIAISVAAYLLSLTGNRKGSNLLDWKTLKKELNLSHEEISLR